MKNNLKCEIVRDLLPLYIDELTCEVTNKEVEGHLEECKECKGVIDMMKNDVLVNEEVKANKEIDFLKKIKEKTNKKIRIAIIVCVAVFLIILYIKDNCIGTLDNVYNNEVANIEVNGKELNLTIENPFIVREKVEEENGVVTIKTYISANALFVTDKYVIKESFDNEIKRVVLEGLKEKKVIIYDEKQEIDSDIYMLAEKTKECKVSDIEEFEYFEHFLIFAGEYSDGVVIDNSKYYSCKKCDEVCSVKYTANYKNEMEYLIEEYAGEERALRKIKEGIVEYSGYMLACIDDIDEITWELQWRDKKIEIVYTEKDFSKVVGRDIKEYGENHVELQKLKNKMPEVIEKIVE